MSWSIFTAGTPEKVLEQVQIIKSCGDASQLNSVRQVLIDELLALKTKDVGVSLEASGHHDSNQGVRSLDIKFRTWPNYKKEA